ncbi:MAG: hypothetical protein AB1486_26220 [Planctomycetota bacterium]
MHTTNDGSWYDVPPRRRTWPPREPARELSLVLMRHGVYAAVCP